MRPLVFLHGFTGAPGCWDEIRARLDRPARALALLGHDPAARGPTCFVEEVDRLAAQLGPGPFHLCGYSLGARVALGLLCRHPRLFSRATLIGVHPGLADPEERAARLGADGAWLALLAQGIVPFTEAWERQPLFATQSRLPAAVLAAQRARRLAHDPAGLAACLRALGLGAMPCFTPHVPALPIDLVAGSEDAKFLALASELARAVPTARLRPVPGGHNAIIEAPDALCAVLREEDP